MFKRGMNNIICVENLCKTYKQGDLKVDALQNLNFKVEDGEFITIIGKSGSGKTTLLNVLSGLDGVTGGSIVINGRDITKLNQNELALFRRREVGLMFQFFNLIPELNVYENIAYPVWLDGKKEDKEYINNIIKILELEDRIKHLPDQLSGGQQQRVALARSLSNRAQIILCDEPTGNLDESSGQEVWSMLHALHKKLRKTIIVVTHDVDMAKTASRCFNIRNGELFIEEACE